MRELPRCEPMSTPLPEVCVIMPLDLSKESKEERSRFSEVAGRVSLPGRSEQHDLVVRPTLERCAITALGGRSAEHGLGARERANISAGRLGGRELAGRQCDEGPI